MRVWIMATIVGHFVSTAVAGPIDPAPPKTLSNQLADADAVVLTRCLKAKSLRDKKRPATFEITRIVKDPNKRLKLAQQITVSDFATDKIGGQFLLLGFKTKKGMQWQADPFDLHTSPLPIRGNLLNYILNVPPPSKPTKDRLPYFIKFLESKERVIADDAYQELTDVSFKELLPLKESFPRDKLRAWVFEDSKISRLHRGLYGMMLGLCGNADDAERMEKLIIKNSKKFRLGLDGVMTGYLWLTKEKGLEVLERTKFKKDVTFAETYGAMQAIRSVRHYTPGHIKQERLNQAMRRILDLPEIADLAIVNLSRWKDWTIQNRLMCIYGVKPYHEDWTKRAVIQYMIAAKNDNVPSKPGSSRTHIAKAKQYLANIRECDPKFFEKVSRVLDKKTQ